MSKSINISYINSLMTEIHEYTDGIYESLCDDDMDTLKESIENLYKVLEDIGDSFFYE